jgi:NADPH:quinone reductase-like Zn-dependent oxidoreductase
MVVNIKEALKYALLSVVLTFIHLLNVLVINPLQNISKLLTETPELTRKLLKHSYHGKNCVVTGGSSGIGKELAIQLSSLGANVIISSRSIEKLEDVAAQCRLLYPQTQIFPIILDLEKYDNISEYTKTVLQTLKENGLPQRIDVLINNAGLSSRGAAMDTSMQTLQKIMVCITPSTSS